MVDRSSVIRISGLVKRYDQIEAVRSVDLSVEKGEIYGLIGPDGSGKSSLMRAAAGILRYDQGHVEVMGQQVASERQAEKIKDRLGYMPQGLGQNLYPELSVEENIDFFARMRLMQSRELKERKKQLLAMTRLTEFTNRPMKNLSGGMKQKLGLICTLIHGPEVLILDEPTTGVDPVSRRDFWAILTNLLREGSITALVSTAYMDEASRFQRLTLMFDGRTVATGTPADIMQRVPGTLVSVRAEPQLRALKALKEKFAQADARGPAIQVFVPDKEPEAAEGEVRSSLVDTDITSLSSGPPSLEDLFVAMLHRRELAKERGPVRIESEETSEEQAKKTVIEALDLVREFGSFRAVDQVGFRVRQGEIFGLLGPNGAGKTTVIKMLVGIVPPTSGSGTVAGADMTSGGRKVKEKIGYMSQVFSLYEDLTVMENIKLYGGIYGLPGKEVSERSEWVLEMADLSGFESSLAGDLPVGVRQRLALGCALVHRPRVLFLDEPTSGVDPVGRRRFWDILYTLSRKEGVAMLITTHYMNEAEHCDHLALMHGGRIVADASPEEMKEDVRAEAGGLLEITAKEYLRALEILERAGYENPTLHGRSVHILVPEPERKKDEIKKILQEKGIEVESIVQQPLTMEDVFVHQVLSLEQDNREGR